MGDVELHQGDCRSILPTIPDWSIDAIITDPPYPCVRREYGYWTEAEWHGLMRAVVGECRRVLKPFGSAVFILQPNSRKAGSMRPWLFDFQAWVCREWNMVQDVHWWNTSAFPMGGSTEKGLLRPSLKACVWLGDPDCYRDQDSVLLEESASNRRDRRAGDYDSRQAPSRVRSATEGPRDDYRRMRTACERRGGVTPFNVLPFGSSSPTNGGTHDHSASTPIGVLDWWIRYLCPPGGTVLDPFLGSGTTALAAAKLGRRCVGIEAHGPYVEIARRRLDGPPTPLFDGPTADRPIDETPLFAGLPED